MSDTCKSHLLALKPGTQLGHYKIGHVLGFGGFGITYHAQDLSLNREVAIKELLPSDFATRDHDGNTVAPKTQLEEETFRWALSRFMEEGRILAACHHESIVTVHEIFEANGSGYMVTEFLDGLSFGEWLKRQAKPPSQEELLAIVDRLSSGLELVHDNGFLHRDIKPENIIINERGEPILIDFGSARMAVGSKTRAMTAVLTPAFAPFEQYHEEGNQGPWTDLYSLGAVLFTAMTGQAPPEAPARARHPNPIELKKKAKGRYNTKFIDAIVWALEFDEEDRPQSVADWRTALELADPNSGLQMSTQRRTERRSPSARQRKRVLALVALWMIVLGAAGATAVWGLKSGRLDIESVTGMFSNEELREAELTQLKLQKSVADGFAALDASHTSARDLSVRVRNERDRVDRLWVEITKDFAQPADASARLTSLRQEAKATLQQVETAVMQTAADLKRLESIRAEARESGDSRSSAREAAALVGKLRIRQDKVALASDQIRKARMGIADEVARLLAAERETGKAEAEQLARVEAQKRLAAEREAARLTEERRQAEANALAAEQERLRNVRERAEMERRVREAENNDRKSVHDFIMQHLTFLVHEDMNGMLSGYAATVDFHNVSSRATHSMIRNDRYKMFENYIRMSITVLGETEIHFNADRTNVSVAFDWKYDYTKNSGKRLTGTARDHWTLQRYGSSWKITAEKQAISRN